MQGKATDRIWTSNGASDHSSGVCSDTWTGGLGAARATAPSDNVYATAATHIVFALDVGKFPEALSSYTDLRQLAVLIQTSSQLQRANGIEYSVLSVRHF